MFSFFGCHNDFVLLRSHAQNLQVVPRVSIPNDTASYPAEGITHGHVLKGGGVVERGSDRDAVLVHDDKTYDPLMCLYSI